MSTKMKTKTDMAGALSIAAATSAHRVLPSSEILVHRSFGILERLMNQLEVKAGSGAELTRDDIISFRAAQQALCDLRKDEREEAKSSNNDEDLTDEEVFAILGAKGFDLVPKEQLTSGKPPKKATK